MKRSEINQIIVEAEAFLEEHKFHLPPWAKWGLSEWKDNIDNVSEITDNMLGWDITDFGSGEFYKRGLFLFTLRNGKYKVDKKPYAEKIMIVAPGLTKEGLDCYASFSPNGIVPQKTPFTFLHGDMPVLRSDYDIVANDPKEAVSVLLDRVDRRPIPFHWFRNILKTPTWYAEIVDELSKNRPNIELLDAPTFFELYRIWLQQNSEAANGEIYMEPL